MLMNISHLFIFFFFFLEFVRTGVVYYPAFKFVLYPSIQDALNAVRDGLAPLALLPTVS